MPFDLYAFIMVLKKLLEFSEYIVRLTLRQPGFFCNVNGQGVHWKNE